MRCMKKIENEKAVETLSVIKLVSSESYNEEDRNREPAGSSKGGQFAKKGGGVYSDREIDPKDLNEDSDFRKDEVISEEDYEKLEIGDEYVEYSRNTTGYLRPTDEGYNLGKSLTIKVKNEYTDDPDQYVKELKHYYDDDGKHVTTMTVEKTDSERDAEYVSSEKRLNENGEFEEIEYTDEEHYKNLKRFVQSYSKRGDEHKIWDKLQEKTLKVQSKNSRFSDFSNKIKELNKEILELNISSRDDKELLKEKDLKELELYKLQYGKEYDDVSKLKFTDYYDMKQKLSVAYKNDRRELSLKNSGINSDKDKTTIPFEDMKDYVKELDPKEKLIFEKFNRIKDNLNSDIEKGKIKGIGLDKMNDNFILSYENNVVMNNIGSERGEKNMDKIDTSRKMYEMLDQTNEKYYEDSSSNMTIGSSYFNVIEHIKNKNEVDDEKMKKFDEELKAIQETEKNKNSKEWTEKFIEKMDYEKSVEDSMTDRDQKILETNEEMTKYTKYSKDYVNSIKDDTQFIKLRNKNEYITPLIEKNIHLYSFPDKNSSIPEETIRHAYDKIKETYAKNNWVSTDLKNRVKSPDHTGLVRIPDNIQRGEEERKMNYQLHEKEGRPFTSGGKTFKQGGNWDKINESINVFKATERAIDWVHDHELAHSFYDYTVDAIDGGQLKNKKVSLDKWKSTVLNLDPKIIEPILGNYPTTYLNDYLKDPTSKNNQFMLAHEMFSGITDLKTGKMKGRYDDIEEAYEELNRHYPELVKAYETLKGVEDYNIYGESLTKDIVKEDVQSNEFAYQQTSYLNDDYNVVTKKNATNIVVKSYTEDGRLILSESYFVEKQATEDNPNREPAGSADGVGGQFAKKDGGSISDIKKDLQKNIEPTEKETEIQTKIDVDVRARIQEKIDELGLTDKVDYVETQGSYVKGTDLPSKGSDMDIFVVFNPNVGEEERKDLGLKIGLATLDKEYANSQGWDNFKVDAKDQENKYAEAFFDVDGQTVEVQIVPTRNMDRYDIIKKEINGQKETADGKKISIGMERTPHQTKFMNENLSVEQKLEVRTLKKFMKETGLYDSSVKSQGFSGYSTEVLIHNLGSFENVVDYFADYKMEKVVGLPSESDRKDLAEHGVELTYVGKNKETKMDETKDKYTEEYYNTHESYQNNSIHMTDPIDPNRDIGGAISEAKLAKTILTMKHVKEYGKAPDKVEPTTMNGVSLTFTSSGTDENTVGSQVQKLQKNMIDNLKDLGFKVEKEFDEPMNIVKGLDVNPNRTSIEQEKGSKEITLNFGMNELYNDSETKKEKDVSDMKEQQLTGMIMGMDKKGTRYEHDKEKGIITTYNPRQFKNVRDAVKGLLEGSVKGKALEDSALLKDIREQNVDPFTKFSKFENIV